MHASWSQDSSRLHGGGSARPGHRPDLPGQVSTAPAAGAAKTQSLLESRLPAAPVLSHPKGGGALRGMGEKFNVTPSCGTGALSIPVRCPPGRSGLQPALSLNYDSGHGNGEFGLGWKLSGADSIVRKTAKGLPRYNDAGSDADTDVFLLAGSEDLVPRWKKRDDGSGVLALGQDGKPVADETVVGGYRVRAYLPRIITVFNRIERWTSLTDSDDIHWRVVSPDNVTGIFGSSDASRVYDTEAASTGGSRRIFAWLQAELYDAHGNAVAFAYKREDDRGVNLAQAHELNRSGFARRNQVYLKTVRYGNVVPNRHLVTWEAFSAHDLPPDGATWKYSVVLDYGELSLENPKPGDDAEGRGAWAVRRDPFSHYVSGFEVRTYRLCRRILVFHHFAEELGAPDYLVSSVDVSYDQSPTVTYLAAAQQAGYTGAGVSGSPPLRRTFPPVEFTYTRFPSPQELARAPVETVDPASVENLPIGPDGSSYRWLDLDGEGISGVLAVGHEAWYYKRNTSTSNCSWSAAGSASSLSPSPLSTGESSAGSGGSPGDSHSSSRSWFDDGKLTARLGPLEVIDRGPFATATALSMQFGDVNGNGKLDLISRVAGTWGYYERRGDPLSGEAPGWDDFRPFQSFPSIQFDGNMQLLDLTGDGLADILVYEDRVYSWFPSLGSAGYGPPQDSTQDQDEALGPVCVFSDTEQTMFLADMSGDGLLDLCRVRNGDCCYWPQLGYCRFGARVSFDGAPWVDAQDTFDPKRVRLADLDGSGPADMLYLANDGADVYLNEAGNGFSDKMHIALPAVDSSSAFHLVDLLGNGTQCLVWSSPLAGHASAPMAYVDVFGNKKPHLLVNVANNLGDETRIHYAPSIKFYLEDKHEGRPWATRVHYPVYYRYAHGFYDGVEREFRGFSRVDQTDTSRFSSFKGTNANAAWNVPPVRTATWYHTGAYFDDAVLSQKLEREYFRPDEVAAQSQAWALENTVMPPECVEGQQMAEACRALKGKVLRVETFSDDGSPQAGIPYSVQESNYTIAATQPVMDAHGHGIYFVHARETLASAYDRVPEDPRIVHSLVLEVDAFGNVRKDLRVSYGRHYGQDGGDLDPAHASKQQATVMLYNEVDVTNSVLVPGKDYRTPMQCESRQYELRGLRPKPSGSRRIDFKDVVANGLEAIVSMPEIAFEDQGNPSLPQKRLLRRERALFRADGLSGLLPLGRMESLGLPGAYHKLAFSPGLFQRLYTKTRPDGSSETLLTKTEALGPDKGYADLDGDGALWTASAGAFYTADASASAAQELAEARASFFLPKRIVDQFGNTSLSGYDGHSLFLTTTRDALGNTASGVVDYRALELKQMTDANGNVVETAHDALGMVAGVAVLGKPASDQLGDTLEGFQADLSQDRTDAFLANPTAEEALALLGKATSRIFYDAWHVRQTGQPVYSCFISREVHVNAPEPPGGALVQVQFSYTDGFGRPVQVKTRTTPGPLVEGGPDVPDRWVGSGWTVYNNKGKPVKQFEPFFDATAAFQPDERAGVSPILLYDALDRVAAVVRPDRGWEKTTLGPWRQQAFDANDNVLLSDPRQDADVGRILSGLAESDLLPSWYDARKAGDMGRLEKESADKSAAHANTPTTTHTDSMGRPFLVIADTGDDKIATAADLDALGNARAVYDGLGRKSRTVDVDMCQRPVRSATIDSGPAWSFPDGAGSPCLSWNNRDFRFRVEHDQLRRPTKSFWRDAGARDELLTSWVVYGEEYAPAAGGSDTAEAHNLRGHVWQVLDQSGATTNTDYDWDGNLIASRRRLMAEYKAVQSVSRDMVLEADEYATSEAFDLLRRSVRATAPDGTVTVRVYNQSTQLDRIYVNVRGKQDPQSDPTTWTAVLAGVDYNARGQAMRTRHGNGTTTFRTYDPLLFRLGRLLTTRSDGTRIQDLTYTYDPVGNVTHIADAAQQAVFFRNAVADPSSDYTYDATYRLTAASGREHVGQTNGRPGRPTAPGSSDRTHDAADGVSGNDGQAMGLYSEAYVYDRAGNLLSVRHAGGAQAGGWTRRYAYAEPGQLDAGVVSNRLSSTSAGAATETYRYDGSAGRTGNMTAMAHLRLMEWDFGDRLKATVKQAVGGTAAAVPETAYYVYDVHGSRVRKVVESQAGPNGPAAPTRLQERIYLGDYEVFRKYSGSGASSPDGGNASRQPGPSLERTTLHAGSDYGPAADVCVRTLGSDAGVARQLRFQLHNHLGSVSLELDAAAQLLSYEEYFPLGGTSYRAPAGRTDAPKRYRFSGKELDAENGMYYFGARYYAAWLGRWTAADPVVSGPGSRYDYAANNPIRLVDPDGSAPKPAAGGGSTGGGGNLGWINIPSSSTLGTAVHAVALTVLEGRLLFHGFSSRVEYRTLQGGSKNNPFDEGEPGGRVDLAVLTPKYYIPSLSWVAHIYELKPDDRFGHVCDATIYRYQSETQLYSKYFDKDLGSMGRVVEARSGAVLADLERGGLGILDPIQLSTPLGDVRIRLRLPDTNAKGDKVMGLILYQVQVKPNEKQTAEELSKWALESITAAAAAAAAIGALGIWGIQVLTPSQLTPSPVPTNTPPSTRWSPASSKPNSVQWDSDSGNTWLSVAATVLVGIGLALLMRGMPAPGGVTTSVEGTVFPTEKKKYEVY